MPSPDRPLHPGLPRRSRGPRAGFSLVEVMLVMVVLTVAVSMLSGLVATTASMGPLQLQNALASEAARAQLERMRIEQAGLVYALFNQDHSDDPGGVGTAPGCHFDVPGLSPRPEDSDGLCGFVRFPEQGGHLRETAGDRSLGMPRDLDLDGFIGMEPVDKSYRILPLEIRIEWQHGETLRSYSLYSMLVRP